MTALVTGASSGMGFEYARQLAAAGCRVLMVSNQAEALEECAEKLRKQYSAPIWAKYADLAVDRGRARPFPLLRGNGTGNRHSHQQCGDVFL